MLQTVALRPVGALVVPSSHVFCTRRARHRAPTEGDLHPPITTTLIHQPLIAAKDEPSRFDQVIQEIATEQDILLAAPYISWRYLSAVAGMASSWLLLTDVEAWLANEKSPQDAAKFILDHPEQIHHCPDLHAKVVMSRKQALIGSANLTRKGLTGRQEMGVLLDDPNILEQLTLWFTDLWQSTQPPRPEELPRVLQQLPPRTAPIDPKARLWTPYKGVRTKLLTPLQSLDKKPSPPVKDSSSNMALQAKGAVDLERESTPKNFDEYLVNRLRLLARSREEASAFLDMLAWPLRACGLSPDDARVVVSAPRSEREMNVHFNIWQVVSWKEGGKLSLLFEAIPFPELPVEYASREVSIPGGPFQWQRFPWDPSIPLPIRVGSSWQRAFEEALRQRKKSFHRRWHSQALARVLVDNVAREALLDEAYPRQERVTPIAIADPTEEHALASICRQMPSRNFANTFFDLVALFLDISGLSGDDPRLACTIRQDSSRITVQIGPRYVLTAKMIGPLGPHYGMIAPADFCSSTIPSPPIEAVYPTEFKLTAKDQERMGYMDVRPRRVKDLPVPLITAWQRGILHEMNRNIATPQRHRHRPVVLAAAKDSTVRVRVLRFAFPQHDEAQGAEIEDTLQQGSGTSSSASQKEALTTQSRSPQA